MDFALCLDCDARMFDLALVFLETFCYPAIHLVVNERKVEFVRVLSYKAT